MGFRIPVQPHVAHFCIGHHGQHTIYHTQTGSEDGNNGNVFSRQHLYLRGTYGRFYLHIHQRKISRCFIGHQHGNLFHQFPKILHIGVCLANHPCLVLNQRMVEYIYFSHNSPPSFLSYDNCSMMKRPPSHGRLAFPPYDYI